MLSDSAGWLLAISLAVHYLPIAHEPRSRTFGCKNGTTFEVVLRNEIADVTFSHGEQYHLRLKASSIGQRFVSSDATLIIDGRFAAFVSNTRSDLSQCRLAQVSVRNGSKSDTASLDGKQAPIESFT